MTRYVIDFLDSADPDPGIIENSLALKKIITHEVEKERRARYQANPSFDESHRFIAIIDLTDLPMFFE